MLPNVPVLTTARLALRGHRADDLPACVSMWSDPVVTRHIGGQPSSEEQVWGRILNYVGHWSMLGFGFWLIEERESGRFVGEVGIFDGRRKLEPDWGRVPEVGWALAAWAHGRGLATEAVLAVLAWSDQMLDARRTVCMIEPANVASRRVADKCGYREFAQGCYAGNNVGLFERVR